MHKINTERLKKFLFWGLFFLLCIIFLVSCSVNPTKDSNNTKLILNKNTIENINNTTQTSINNQTSTQREPVCDNQPASNYYVAPRPNYTLGLLSLRIYSGVLEPKSFLITNFKPLEDGIRSYLDENNINASIYIENLRNGANIGIHENRGYFPASLNKLPVAILIMQKIEDGKLGLDTLLPIQDYERTDVSGNLYLTKEKELSVRVLMEKMLKESDNTAFNVLYDHADKNELRNLLNYYDVSINVHYPSRRVEFLNHTDTVTARSLYNLFSSLYLSTVLNPQDSEYLLSLLTETTFDIKTLADLPDNVTVAQKYGEYYVDDAKLFHDCGIMYVGASRIFYCIMTKDLEPDDAKEAIGYIVNYMYNYVVDTRARLDLYRDSIMRG